VSGRHALLIDFGSTYTKLRAVDLDRARVAASGQGPSTVTTDISVGMRAALDDLGARMGRLPRFVCRLASSSAAGGLRMVTVGLVKELTAEAARRAALGAGAKLVGAYAYTLTRSDVATIERLAPDILLLAGGTDGGNFETILRNAETLASATIACPVIVAGNRAVADEARDALAAGGKDARVCGNVMPEFGVLDIEPAREAIRQVFIERIVHAKGIDRAAAHFDRVLMPTPAAVLEGAKALAADLGGVLVVDPGGATTDVHSVGQGAPTRPEIVPSGLPEPFAKRTVEGDLGMRHNARTIVETEGTKKFAAQARLAPDAVERLLAAISRDPSRLPSDEAERALDRALARAAISIAVKRHAGTLETVYTATGPVVVQRGKDLGAFEVMIGTGGPIVHAPDPGAVLVGALADPAEPASLRPRAPRVLLDRDYLLYAVGLLAGDEPGPARELARAGLVDITQGTKNDYSAA